MLNLPANFETYAEARKAGFMKMKEIKDNGGRIVGVYCSFVPQELLMLPVLPLRLYALPAMNRFLLPRRNCPEISVR